MWLEDYLKNSKYKIYFCKPKMIKFPFMAFFQPCNLWSLKIIKFYIKTFDKYYFKFIQERFKICIIEVYLLKYYFKRYLIYKWGYYRQTIFDQFDIILVSYGEIIGICHSVAIISCEVAALPFQADANYQTWSIDFGKVQKIMICHHTKI